MIVKSIDCHCINFLKLQFKTNFALWTGIVSYMCTFIITINVCKEQPMTYELAVAYEHRNIKCVSTCLRTLNLPQGESFKNSVNSRVFKTILRHYYSDFQASMWFAFIKYSVWKGRHKIIRSQGFSSGKMQQKNSIGLTREMRCTVVYEMYGGL